MESSNRKMTLHAAKRTVFGVSCWMPYNSSARLSSGTTSPRSEGREGPDAGDPLGDSLAAAGGSRRDGRGSRGGEVLGGSSAPGDRARTLPSDLSDALFPFALRRTKKLSTAWGKIFLLKSSPFVFPRIFFLQR